MTDDDERTGESPLHRRYPYGVGYVRLVLPVVAMACGALLALRNAGRLGAGGDGALLFWLGTGLVVLAVAALLVARWMARRGL